MNRRTVRISLNLNCTSGIFPHVSSGNVLEGHPFRELLRFKWLVVNFNNSLSEICFCQLNSLDWSLLVKHLVFEDITKSCVYLQKSASVLCVVYRPLSAGVSTWNEISGFLSASNYLIVNDARMEWLMYRCFMLSSERLLVKTLKKLDNWFRFLYVNCLYAIACGCCVGYIWQKKRCTFWNLLCLFWHLIVP